MRLWSVSSSSKRMASAIALVLTATAHAEAPYSFGATPGKLPKDVVPLEYVAHLVPDIAANTFSGTETVEIDVLQPTSWIKLNVENIDIDAASLSGKGMSGQTLTPQIDRQQQTLTFTLAEPLARGRYSLFLQFRGMINRAPRGLFAMKYQVGSLEKTMLATTMEPTDARRVLPSWDEPAFRARFKLSVDVPASFSAYSNTPLEKHEKLASGLQRLSFGVTPKMPSYLMVLVAGELERISAKQDGVDIGIVTAAGRQQTARFALDASKDLLRYYNNYFGIPYPLAKLDQIAIPGGFNGAMENWGGIVYNEAALLYDARKSTESTKLTSFVTNAHETAHMWFGDLVTMAWWDNLWLNEGFASWMSSKATDHFHPEWHIWLDRLVERDSVMNLDALKTTHPIQTPILSEEQAAGAFDQITYGKGEAFLRMLESYLGEETFRQGIRAYMLKHQYSNTTSADLWAALEQVSGKPVEKLASDWTTQPGFPLVKVAQSCDQGQRKITLSQEPFWLDEAPSVQRLWHIPLQLGIIGGATDYVLLNQASTTITRPGCNGALVVDPSSVGYYRVQYDQLSFDALAEQMQHLPDTTRVKLLADTWAMMVADRLPLATYLELATKYRDEPRLAIRSALLNKLGALKNMAIGQPERQLLQRYIRALVASRFEALGWDEKPDDSVEDRKLRATLAMVLALAGDETVIAEARARFQHFLVEPDSLAPSLLDFVMFVVGRYADAASYDALRGLATRAHSTEERNRYAMALSGTLDPTLAARSLQVALSPNLPTQLTSMLVPRVSGNGHIDQAWIFAVLNHDALMKLQDAISRNHFFPSIVGSSSEASDADMMEAYVKENFGADAQIDAKRTAAAIRIRAIQKARLRPQVSAALKDGTP